MAMMGVMWLAGLAAVSFALFLWILSIPICIGAVLQLILSVVAIKPWVLFIPAILGAIGLVLCLLFLVPTFSIGSILIYWLIYFVCLWLVWLIVTQIKQAVIRWRSKE